MDGSSPSDISFLSSLQLGEWVEILDKTNAINWRGAVQETAPELGVVWVRGETGERRLLDLREHRVQRYRQQGPLLSSGRE